MHYYQFNIGDYRRKTAYLTPLEHGIYRILLDTYYLEEKPLCADNAFLMRTHNIRTDDEIKAFKNVISDFFVLTDEGYINPHCDKMIEEFRQKSEKASKSAKERWAKKANAMRTHSEGNAKHKPITINQEPNNTMSSQSDNPAQKVPFKEIIELYHKTLPELPRCEILNKTREGYIRQRWQDKTHGLPTLTHWENYFLHVSRSRFLMGKTEPVNGRPPFRANLEWLTKLSNYTKVYEDKYHE